MKRFNLSEEFGLAIKCTNGQGKGMIEFMFFYLNQCCSYNSFHIKNRVLGKQLRSDNDASELDILGHLKNLKNF